MSVPSLSLRALLGRAVAQLSLESLGPITGGLTPAAKALAAAACARRVGLTVLVVPTDKDIEPTVADARFFYGALEGAAIEAVERAVLPFPSIQVDPYRGMHPHFRVSAARAQALYQAASGGARLIVTSAAALLPKVSAPARLVGAAITIHPGTEIEPIRLADLLVDGGFTREDPVDEHGSFTVRGGILDVFPARDAQPVRIEFVGDMVESIRRFDPSTQRSIAPVDQVTIVPVRERFEDDDDLWPALDALAAARGVHVVVSEPGLVEEHASQVRSQLETSYADAVRRGPVDLKAPSVAFVGWDELGGRLAPAPRLLELAIQEAGAGAVREVPSQPAVEFRGRIADWIADVRAARARGEQVLFVAASAGRAERSIEILRDYELVAVPAEQAEGAHLAAVLVAVGTLSRGFRLPGAALQIYAETDVFEEERYATGSRPSLSKTFLSDLRELKVGDLIVHVDHGIGEFVGLKQLGVGGTEQAAQEFLELRYAGDDKLFVPVERLDLVQKYSGGARPSLDRLGGTSWEKAKTRVKKAMRDMAEELLKLYAQRKAVPGHAFGADTHWQEEFEGAFPFELTPDQATATADIKKDMEAPAPMDRLLCGDVGYGKTEVAVRAAFKAVMDGKQVAFLAPTTVLAFQHLKTLKERFAGFPVVVEMVSRFRSKAEIAEVLAGVASGRVDVIVGTHRLLSRDVVFRDLGLLVVDEEQRFGVAHKERIKQLRRKVDVLTMTATPIPRTLNMSLVGIRDMSVIETPPKDRLSIQTNVVAFDAGVIERAVRAELARGGQVYFVHNRVESIASIGGLLQRLVPEARLVVGHGQMGEEELERAMLGFVERRFDILLATTIVENGLDIPNANTIIINRADRYGLSQLYQLRGRVGRSDRPAYAYLLVPPRNALSPVARKRLAVIKEFSDLGSGFRVAALDLEIRGAGNLLGGEQSGHIDAVGFEMYMKLLEDAVRELKGEALDDDTRATVNLRVDLAIDDEYIPEMSQRLMTYRKVAEARSEAELEAVVAGIRDRYGALPDSVLNLAEYGRIRVLSDRIGVDSIERDGRTVAIKFGSRTTVDPIRLIQIVRDRPGLTLVPPGALKLDLEAAATASAAVAGRSGPSWWTSRARTGSVATGFTKQEMLRRPVMDPWAPGGLYAQLEGLLRALG
jgi:transcription-repair coupling factor (superfamily II helicase)